MRSLLLVGYGSQETVAPALALEAVADQLRGQAGFSEVLTGYVLQEPAVRGALRRVRTSDVTVVALAGFGNRSGSLITLSQRQSEQLLFERVIPHALGLGFRGEVPPGGVVRVLSGKTVRYLGQAPCGDAATLLDWALAGGGSGAAREGDFDPGARKVWDDFFALLGHSGSLRLGEALLRGQGENFMNCATP
ncbi:hypothetical protein ACFP81_04660 [Deinococcus lacus]|uniref:Uncharacterized protein n=1 Tax=Deinococcus lacus TaxID=392561 RepID=A0ABW1YAY5_9DEIO